MPLDPIKCFRLREVKLRTTKFRPAKSIDDMVIEESSTAIQTRRWVQHEFIDKNAPSGAVNFLKAIANFGIRVIQTDGSELDEDGEPKGKVAYTLEASFAVYFEVLCEDYAENDLAFFLDANVQHIAWPFWREYVFSTLRSASLPLVEIPLMPAIRQATKQLLTVGE